MIIIDNVEDLLFNITLEYYENKVYVESLSDRYDNVFISIEDFNGNFIYGTNSNYEYNKNLKYWLSPSKSFTEVNGIVVKVIDLESNILTQESFKFSCEWGRIKPPLLQVIHHLGIGDFFMATPFIRKMYKIYRQKINIIGYSEYKEVVKNNRYVNNFYDNSSFDYTNYEEKYEVIKIYDDWFSFRWNDIRQVAARSLNITLLENELKYDFIPDKYITISNLPKKYVCIYPYKTGIDRDIGEEKYQKLINILNTMGIFVVTIGQKNSCYENLNINLGLNLCGLDLQNNFSQKWHIINRSDVFITFDSSLYVLAATTNTHIIQLGWYSNPSLHQQVRNGDRNYKYTYLIGECEEHCLTNQIYDINIYGTIKGEYQRRVQICPLKKDFICKPEPEKIVNEVLKIKNKL